MQYKEGGLKLNARKLYAADAKCVPELLKVAASLRRAMEKAMDYNADEVCTIESHIRKQINNVI